MKYVLDSSVGLKWVLAEQDSPKASRLRMDLKGGLLHLIAPDFFPIEIAHALTKAERQQRILPTMGGTLWRDIMTTCPTLFPSLPLIPEAYAIASLFRIGIYDCLYVALANREKCSLMTADDRLVNVLQKDFPFVLSLSALGE